MKLVSRRPFFGAVGMTAVCLLGAALAGGQAPTAAKPELAEQAFTNIQVLRGIPVNEFMETMGFFAASLGANCTFCHTQESSGNWAKYADDIDTKRTARKMIVMMNLINQTYFGGKREVTCYSCHRGDEKPQITPNLALQYGPPLPIEPDTLQEAATDAPTVDQVFAKYIQALGGAPALAKITSFAGKGTYQGYGETEKEPLDVYAKAPDQRAQITHEPFGNMSTVFNGTEGWFAAPENDRPVPVVMLTNGDVNGAKLDAELLFPAQIKSTLKDWRVTYPSSINDRPVTVVQGTADGRTPINFYFDTANGLLLRTVRYGETPTGFVPTQVDYSDYRLVAGVKMPYRWEVTWTDGRAITQLTSLQPNAKVDPARFDKPAPPVAPPPKPKAAKP